MSYHSILLLLSVCLMSSCVKDKPQEPIKSSFSAGTNKVYIINEGNFGWGNSSVSLYDPLSGNSVEDYYTQQNNTALGDVCQSMIKYNNSYYLVMNNSNKIVVTNSDFKKTSVITGFTSPRYILPVTYSKIYVSDLYSNSIQVVDLNSKTITKSIACSGWIEQMVIIYNKAFITNARSKYCFVINTVTDAITDSILIGKGAESLVIDKFSKIWILAAGNIATGENGKLNRIDPVSLQIELSLNFPINESPNKLCANKTRDTLYFLNKGIYQFPIANTQLASAPLINQGSKIYYGLAVSPNDYSIYVSDAIDYVQKSKIEVFNVNGSLKTTFNAGIISNGFIFE